MQTIEKGQLDGQFVGFHSQATFFSFVGGGIWRQAEYKYHYHYAYRPEARVVNEGGRYVLYVEGMDDSVEVQRYR